MPSTSRVSPRNLPKNWKQSIRSGVLHVISLAHYAVVQARGRAATGTSAEARLIAENDRLRHEIALLQEELRIKDARINRIAAQRRPHYTSYERMAILETKAARGWSLEQTARAFHVTPQTVAEWLGRIDEQVGHPIVQMREPVNKFPEFVQYVVQRLKTLCPAMGKRKIAEALARAGLHLAATTVDRMLREPSPGALKAESSKPGRIRANRPNHVWHVDLTTVPISGGFWVPWLPLALPQCWPFCWWIAVVVDQFSRRVMGMRTFKRQPSSEELRSRIGRTIHQAGASPKHLVCDRGKQFDCHAFRRWCGRKGIQVRYGAVGRQASIAIVERLIRTLKELLRMLILIPIRQAAFRQELQVIVEWYNSFRPHASLGGRAPDEVYFRKFPANRRPRHEPREKWPRGAPCARPWALIRGRPGAEIELQIEFLAGRKHLPVVTLKRVA